jgi:hypothetical protein
MKAYLTLSLIFFSLFLWSCEENIYSDEEFYGEWHCHELIQYDDVQKIIEDQVVFNFNKDNTYTYKGGTYSEEGKWELKGRILVTNATGQTLKRVEIQDKTPDSVTLNMNDGGVPTKMKLHKKD